MIVDNMFPQTSIGRVMTPPAAEQDRALRAVLRVVPVAWISRMVIRLVARRLPVEDRARFLTSAGEDIVIGLRTDKIAQLRNTIDLRHYLRNLRGLDLGEDEPTDE